MTHWHVGVLEVATDIAAHAEALHDRQDPTLMAELKETISSRPTVLKP